MPTPPVRSLPSRKPRRAAAEADTRATLTPETWIEAATEVLVDQGIDHVRVDVLATQLGVTRGSFYWHFRDRDALLAALLARWEAKNTGNLVARTLAFAATINEAILNVFDAWLEAAVFDSRFDFAVRTWALSDAAVRAKVQATDALRMDALAAMFARFGYSPIAAETRARALYYTQIGYISMLVAETVEVRLAEHDTAWLEWIGRDKCTAR
ncbi:MAG: TetR/AcrR family transcriptional regulator [Phycisphaerae bacterium]|nr:TetR/AcrR family transcriptional regulator [Phycisphaerae bacterium]